MAKALSLLKAYLNEEIPDNGGFIITGQFSPNSSYAIYEVTAYKNVKDIFQTKDGFTFKTDGNRTHLLVEPATYAKKYIDPVNREGESMVPYRFNELQIVNCAKNEKVMIPNEPVFLYSSFTILQRDADYFAFVFYPTEDVYIAMKKFIADSLYNDCALTKRDAISVAETLLVTIKKFNIWSA